MTTHGPFHTPRKHLLSAILATRNRDFLQAMAEAQVGLLALGIEFITGEAPVGHHGDPPSED